MLASALTSISRNLLFLCSEWPGSGGNGYEEDMSILRYPEFTVYDVLALASHLYVGNSEPTLLLLLLGSATAQLVLEDGMAGMGKVCLFEGTNVLLSFTHSFITQHIH